MFVLRQLARIGLLSGIVAAVPIGNSTANSTQGNAGKQLTLVPARHPKVNSTDTSHLKAVNKVQMYFDSDSDPSTDSATATLTADNPKYPIVHLENSEFVQSINCANGIATISFNQTEAYQTARTSWQSSSTFVLMSYSPNCGNGFSVGQRTYALANNVTAHDDAMTIVVATQMVDYETAIGSNTTTHISVGAYQAPQTPQVAQRSQAIQARDPFGVSGSKSFSMHWNEYPTNTLSDQRFGPGFELLKSNELDVICAGCGTDGALTFTAEIDFSIFHGLETADVSLTGNMEGALALGLIGRNASVPIPIDTVQLAQVGLPGLSIPALLSIGPQLDISVSGKVKLDVSGDALIGAGLKWNNLDVKVGLTDDHSHSGNGLTPEITHKFNASGDVSATLDVSLPISLGVGINILDGKFNKQLALVETPGFSVTTSKDDEKSSSCSGIGLNADFNNNVGINVLGLTTFGLESTTVPLFSTCFSETKTIPPTSTHTSTQTSGNPRTTRTHPHTTPTGRPLSTGVSGGPRSTTRPFVSTTTKTVYVCGFQTTVPDPSPAVSSPSSLSSAVSTSTPKPDVSKTASPSSLTSDDSSTKPTHKPTINPIGNPFGRPFPFVGPEIH